MLRLRLLGSTELTGAEDRAYGRFLAQPKRVALLAYLALARARGYLRRDYLASLFWPELTQDQARRALRQGLFVIRHEVAPELVVTRGQEEVSLAEGELWCDALELDAALEAGRPEAALDLYRGELLAGFHVGGAPDFSRWLDDERARLHRRAHEAAVELMQRAEAAGDLDATAAWCRRGLELAPDDEDLLRGLMRALAGGGDRAGALEAFDRFTRRLREELDLEVGPDTAALAAEIRAKAPTAAAPAGEAVVRDAGLAPTPAPEALPARRSRGRRWSGAVAGVAVVAALVWILAALVRSATHEAPPRLVVLPFENVGPSAAEYFADGLTEEITSRLARVAGLAVIAPGSAVPYKRTTKSAAEIGRELGVQYILEGTVRWDSSGGERLVRINPQLVRVDDAAYLWSDRYQARLEGVFGMQAAIAERVAEALELTLAPDQRQALRQPATASPEAHGYYLRARQHFDLTQGRWEQSPGPLRTAEQWLERAVAIDSGYAEAWAALATARLTRWLKTRHDASLLERARVAAARALRLGPTLPESHVAMGAVQGEGLGDWTEARRHFEAALRINPRHAEALAQLAWLRVRFGEREAALPLMERAAALDPGSVRTLLDLAQMAYILGRDSQVVEVLSRVIELNPDLPAGYSGLIRALTFGLGDTAGARAALEAGERRLGRRALLGVGCLTCFFGENPLGLDYADVLDQIQLDGPNPPDSGDYYAAQALVARRQGRRAASMAYIDSNLSVLEPVARSRPIDPELRRNLAYSYFARGRRADGMHELHEALRLMRRQGMAVPGSEATFWGFAHAFLGEPEAAIDSFAVAVRHRDPYLGRYLLRFDAVLEPLRRFPRFQALMRQTETMDR